MLAKFSFRTSDRKAFVVKELVNQHRELDVGSTIHAVIPSRFERSKTRELILPVAKDMRLYADDLGRFADFEKELLRIFEMSSRFCAHRVRLTEIALSPRIDAEPKAGVVAVEERKHSCFAGWTRSGRG